ncbi:hypothetical protein O9993_05530 [Vibrio lentus]|nr:hypothetical protein [Vibrio lentus]
MTGSGDAPVAKTSPKPQLTALLPVDFAPHTDDEEMMLLALDFGCCLTNPIFRYFV